jgi:trans-aconitate methyltransferase
MQFAAPAEHYDRFMGRYAPTLAEALADFAGVGARMRVVDVGCGPGGLTRELVARVGAANVAAIDLEARAGCARRVVPVARS